MSTPLTPHLTPATRTAYHVAMVLTTLAVVMGSVVCATESGMACPTWPGCYPGQVTPIAHINPIIEFTHRVVAVACGPAILAALVLSFTRPPRERLVRILPWVTLVGALAAAVFGRIVVLDGLPPALGMLDLGLSLVAMLAITSATVALRRTPYAVRLGRTAGLAWGGVATVVVMHVLGILTAYPGSFTRCMGWPIWRIIDTDQAPAIQWVRIGLAVLATGLIAGASISAWSRLDLRRTAATLPALWVLELGVGLAMGGQRISLLGAAVYAITAVAILFTLGLLGSLAAIEPMIEPVEAATHLLPDADRSLELRR